MSVLEINNLKKNYGSNQALKGISFSVPQGSIFGLLGPNGSGKTTLLGILLDVLKADSGDFSWTTASGARLERKHIGSLLETPNFYHYLSAKKNLEITSEISGRGNGVNIEEVLKKVGLYERKDSRFSAFSLGMKQRLAIGASLLGSPSIVVLDEPTNGLDPVGIAEIRQLILELKGAGHTVIIASHLLDEIEKICTHVAIMKAGNLLASGPVEEVLREEDLVEVGATELNLLADAMASFPGVRYVKQDGHRLLLGLAKDSFQLEAINKFCFAQGIVLNHLYIRKQKLEAKFFELTKN